jgi:thymidylate synthase
MELDSNINEKAYIKELDGILFNGIKRQTRNYTTISKFGIKLDFDIEDNFPLLTTKKMFWKGICLELLWFIKGSTNSKILEEQGVNIWKKNSCREYLDSVNLEDYEEGDCGPIYGYQWRNFGAKYKSEEKGFDQLQECINLIKNDPTSRRIFMSAWNPNQLNEMCLPPCHVSYQFYVDDDYLSCILYQRSGDMFLGIPFNIASSALLVYIIAKITNKKPKKLSIIIGDAHIYENHITQVVEQLDRKVHNPPKVIIKNSYEKIEDFKFEDFELIDYQFNPSIKAEMIT